MRKKPLVIRNAFRGNNGQMMGMIGKRKQRCRIYGIFFLQIQDQGSVRSGLTESCIRNLRKCPAVPAGRRRAIS